MTAYFDNYDSLVRKIKNEIFCDCDGLTAQDQLELIDKQIVYDVTLCSEMLDCPNDIRAAIDQAVVTYSYIGQPKNSIGLDYENVGEYALILLNLISALHDIFHNLSYRQLDNFGDDPRQPIWELIGNAEERKEKLVPEERQLKKFEEKDEILNDLA